MKCWTGTLVNMWLEVILSSHTQIEFSNRDGDGKVSAADAKELFDNTTELLKFNMPAGAGFSSGLAYGLTGSFRLMAFAPFLYGAGVSTALGGIPMDILTEAEKLGVPARKLHSFGSSIRDQISSFGSSNTSETRDRTMQTYLATLSLQELRDLEARLKQTSDPIVLDPTMAMLGLKIDDKTLMLERIEHSKKAIKGQL